MRQADPGEQDRGDIALLLDTATSLAGIGVFRWDLDRDELDLSTRARAILGLRESGTPSSREVIDATIHPEHRQRALELRERSLTAASDVPSGEWLLLDPNERERWVAMTMRAAPAGGSRATEMVGSLQDVSTRHEWERERETYRAALTALWESSAAIRRRRAAGESPLTPREAEVLQMASHGGSSATIAERLSVSTSTVKTHLEHIYAKLGVADRAGAVAEGLRRRLID